MAVNHNIGRVGSFIRDAKDLIQSMDYGPKESAAESDSREYMGDFHLFSSTEKTFVIGSDTWGSHEHKVGP